MAVHIQKLCVGAASPKELGARQRRMAKASGLAHAYTLTRNRPRRQDEVLTGGHLYWVMRGAFAVRQRVVEIGEVTLDDGTTKCRIGLDFTFEAVAPMTRKAFQGWRYLEPKDAPPLIGSVAEGQDYAFLRELADLGLL